MLPMNKQTTGNPIKDGKRGPGRPKGSQNKVTKAAKDMIAEAADQLGGVERMVAWAKEDPANERAFWTTVFPKLTPLQHSGEDGGPLKIEVVRFASDPAS
jgi:hypothetical protein